MNLDPRIIEGKRVLTPFDIEEAEQFNGLSGYFSNVTDDFKCLDNACYGVLDLAFGEHPYCFTDNNGERHACTYFLPKAWAKKVLDRDTILDVCHEVKRDLAHLYRKQKLLSENMWAYRGCYTEPGYSEAGDRSIAWNMRDILKNAYDEYRKLLKDLEEKDYL